MGNLPELMHDCLYEIHAPRGRRMFVIVNQTVYGDSLEVDSADPINHSRNFSQSYLRLSDTVVGSLLDISARWCCFNSTSVGYMPPQDKVTTFFCPTESHSGGLLVYNDGHGSFFAIPAKIASSPLLVSDDRGD